MKTRLIAAAIVAIFGALTNSAIADRADYGSVKKAIDECIADPAFAPGGANVGDCLTARAEEVQRKIDSVLHQNSKMLCDAESRQMLDGVQTKWISYRDDFCTLAEHSPDNTGSYITGGACRLLVAQQRLEGVLTIGRRTYDRCLALALQTSASRFGALPSETVTHKDSYLSWRQNPRTDEIEVLNEGKSVFAIDAAECSYCNGEEQCSEGVFLFEYLAGTRDEPNLRKYSLLHACTKPEGVSFMLVADLENEPTIVLQETGLKTIDWQIDYDTLTITSADGSVRFWKTPPNVSKPE